MTWARVLYQPDNDSAQLICTHMFFFIVREKKEQLMNVNLKKKNKDWNAKDGAPNEVKKYNK